MRRALQDHLEFFTQFRRQFQTTGAIAPSGRALANALCGPLRDRPGPRRILEIGPGTGAVTEHIVARLQPGDELDLVEINEAFAAGLQRRLKTRWQDAADQTRVHHTSLDAFDGGPYDIVISGLPFNNFPTELVTQLLDRSLDLLADDGTLSFFEYLYVRPLRSRLGRRPDRLRLTRIDRRLARRYNSHDGTLDRVLVNIPPACVRHLRGRPADRAAS